MANLCIFASGNGSNFEEIAKYIQTTNHRVACLICDRKNAFSFERAKKLNIKSYYIPYYKGTQKDAENSIEKILLDEKIDLIALAGFMRLLSPEFVSSWEYKIINIHPSLLPKHPGANGIEDSYNSGDMELGITIHYVDDGMDTGEIIYQESFTRLMNMTLEEVENKIHTIEHTAYPKIIREKLDYIEK